jgi:anti-sigma B factor antagonist
MDGEGLGTTDVASITVRGGLDLSTAAHLMEQVGALLAEAPGAIDVDLSDLSYTDSIGLSVFVTWHFQCLDAGVRLRFLDPSPLVARLLVNSGLSEILEITERDVLVGV